MTAQDPQQTPAYVSVLTPGQQIDLAGLEGSITWLLDDLRRLARSDESAYGRTPEQWAEVAEAAAAWQRSTTALLDAITLHKPRTT